MKVTITKIYCGWMLTINGNGVFQYWIRPKLIDVLEISQILKIHVDNQHELPLKS